MTYIYRGISFLVCGLFLFTEKLAKFIIVADEKYSKLFGKTAIFGAMFFLILSALSQKSWVIYLSAGCMFVFLFFSYLYRIVESMNSAIKFIVTLLVTDVVVALFLAMIMVAISKSINSNINIDLILYLVFFPLYGAVCVIHSLLVDEEVSKLGNLIVGTILLVLTSVANYIFSVRSVPRPDLDLIKIAVDVVAIPLIIISAVCVVAAEAKLYWRKKYYKSEDESEKS